MGNKESKHQSLFSLESWFKNNHGINFQESSSLTLFKSLVAFLPPSSGESYLNEAKVITSSKLIGALNEDIRLKINPHIAFIHEQESLENPDNQIQGFRTISSTIEFDTSTRLAFIELLPYLNGDYAIKEIANIYSTSETEVMHVLQPFYEIGFLVLCSKSLVPAISFYTHLMSSERGKRLNNITPLDTNRDKEDLKSSLVRNLFAHYYYAFSFSDHLSVTIS